MNPNDPITDVAEQEKRFAALLEKPPLVHDPVFPKENYLEPFAKFMYAGVLMQIGQPERVRIIQTMHVEHYKVSLLAGGSLIFIAIDFEEQLQGRSGREIFLDRVKGPIYRLPVPPQMSPLDHSIAVKGVFQIQTATGQAVPGQYEICKLKTIGWYIANLVKRET